MASVRWRAAWSHGLWALGGFTLILLGEGCLAMGIMSQEPAPWLTAAVALTCLGAVSWQLAAVGDNLLDGVAHTPRTARQPKQRPTFLPAHGATTVLTP